MPPLEEMDRHQTALLWAALGVDAYGQKTVAPPREILVRWEFARRQTQDSQGTPITLDATLVVNETIPIGSLLWEGTWDEWSGATGTGSLGEATQLYEARTYEEALDIKGRHTRREVGLVKYRDTLPEVVV